MKNELIAPNERFLFVLIRAHSRLPFAMKMNLNKLHAEKPLDF
jgi:hypothetical protein